MEHALKSVPVMETTAPEGVINSGGEWFYNEYVNGSGVTNLGLDNAPGGNPAIPLPPADERKSILDMFKN